MADQHGAPVHDHGHDHGHAHAAVQVDEQQPPNLQLAGWGVVIAIVFFGSAILVTSLVYPMIDHITSERFTQQAERSPTENPQPLWLPAVERSPQALSQRSPWHFQLRLWRAHP